MEHGLLWGKSCFGYLASVDPAIRQPYAAPDRPNGHTAVAAAPPARPADPVNPHHAVCPTRRSKPPPSAVAGLIPLVLTGGYPPWRLQSPWFATRENALPCAENRGAAAAQIRPVLPV